jgi:1-phosphofructokinase
MITTVCLNPAIDKSADVDQLQVGKVNRLKNTRMAIGGKGINVAVVLSRLRQDVSCVCAVGEADMPFFEQGMEREKLNFYAFQVPGSVRRNLKIVDVKGRTVTEFNEQGAEVDQEAVDELTQVLVRHSRFSRYITLSGSLPPGCGTDTYRNMMRRLPDKRWIVDTSGDALRSALLEKPFLIKPNLTELEELANARLETPEAVKAAAVQLCEQGIAHVAVSMGEQGAILTDGKRTVFAPAVPVTAASTVGAGDSMLAGLLYGLSRGETPFESLRYGTAAGSTCVQGGGVHAFSRQTFSDLLAKVEIREL